VSRSPPTAHQSNARGEPPGPVALEAGAQGPTTLGAVQARDAPPLLLACCLLRSHDDKMAFISSPLLPCCLPASVRWRLPGLSTCSDDASTRMLVWSTSAFVRCELRVPQHLYVKETREQRTTASQRAREPTRARERSRRAIWSYTVQIHGWRC
jgi:hypothetical protein